MVGMAHPWYARFQRGSTPVRVVQPSAWTYGGPASDTTTASTSVTAAASRVVSDTKAKGRTQEASEEWQVEAWGMYDQVGELRYVSNAIAGRCGQAELYVEVDGERKDEDDEILALITPQMVERMALNLFVAGSCYLAGLPATPELTEATQGSSITPQSVGEGDKKTIWLVLSVKEVERKGKGKNAQVVIRGEEYSESSIYLERIWDPHPAEWEQADSPVRSALPVLRELVGLTQHVSAQIDSRLAGAGIYWLPNSILQGAKTPEGGGAQTTFSENPVLNAIMSAMLIPMEDRSNAAALVPLLMGAPDEAIAKIRFDSFSTPFDKNTNALREEAIKRLGLNLDAPPELLLGMGDANHWGMWLVRDEVIQAHVKPRLDLICDAITTGFYRPIKKQLDPGADLDSFVVQPDVSGLVQRPNRLADASQLHAVNAIGDKALREAGGFEESDAPTNQERAEALALTVAQGNPQLLDNMPEIVKAVLAVLDGTPETGPDTLSPQREPGTLKPLVPGTSPVPATTPNGSPAPGANGQAAPIAEAEGRPRAGSPV